MGRLKAYRFYDSLEALLGIFAFIASILSVITFCRDSEPWNSYVIVISLLMLIGAIFAKLIKIATISKNRLKHFSQTFHSITHLIRDEFYLLNSLKTDNKLNKELLENSLEKVCKQVCNKLATLLTVCSGKNVSVCVKYFCLNEPFRLEWKSVDEVKDQTVTVLCRSDNSNPNRRFGENDRVRDNTDIEKITIGTYKQFAITNLSEYTEGNGEKYKSSNHEWGRYYKTKITVPIRLKSKLNFFGGIEGYDLLGFISADAKSTSTFHDDDMNYYVDTLKSVADILYQYFDRFFYLWHENGQEVK